jgi:hypothetical protein
MNLKTVLAASAIMALAAFGTGCGNVCDDAADVCGGGEGAEDGGDAECSGQAECVAQCIVDADSCDLAGDADLQECIGGCAG